jgi:hypothetical protein
MQARRNVNIRNNYFVFGEVVSFYHVLQWVYQPITPPHKTVIPELIFYLRMQAIYLF